jgi:magnesium transporter
MQGDPVHASVLEDSEEAAQRAAHYRLSTLPVVDDADRLVGVITYDDVMETLGDEATEDMYRLAGTLEQHPARETLLRRLLGRFPFLLVTIVGTYGVAWVIKLFQSEAQHDTILRFVPMVAALAGNAGIQASTTMIRGFATGEVQPQDFWSILSREGGLGVLMGASAGFVELVLLLLFHEPRAFCMVVPTAQTISVSTASLIGTSIPFVCWRARFRIGGREFRVDPALAAGPFITTLNDVLSTSIALSLTVKLFPGTFI